MSRSKLLLVANLLIVASMLLSACTQATPQAATATAPGPTPATQAPTQGVVQPSPTPEPVTRTGGWLDEIVFTGQDSAEAAVAQLQAGDLDLYAYTVDDPSVYETVQNDANLGYVNMYGSTNEITFNTAEYADGRLNPFSNPKIREAVNWVFERQYVVDEISGGLGRPKFLPISSAFPDFSRYAATIADIEATYAYNPDKAKEVITAEMEGMGATVGDDGKFLVDGEPLPPLKFLIRTEDERRQIGDYVANQLETVGFTVDRQYKTRSEASPLWVQSDPAEGLWDIYTGGWIYNFIDRDEGDSFSFYYTPNDYPIPLFQAYTPTEEFNEVALKLRNNDFTSLEERDALFTQALRMAIQDSARIFVNDSASFSPFKKGLQVGFDLAAGVAGAQVWPFTIRWEGQEGGTVRIAQPGILVEPWNPIGGSNWIYDAMPQRATTEYAALVDPYTGLTWPQRLETAELTVKEGLPVSKSLDWINLTFEPEITVPADAWADWDATAQTFITVGEKFTETVTANSKYVVYYPADLFETVKWHDGSNISVGDFVMVMIQAFDQGKEDSPIYDAAAAETLAAFLDHFKGVKIVSTDPLVIETYSDQYSLDAEVPFGTLQWTTWWPGFYTFGSGAWHNLTPGILAEAAGELAFSSAKADEKQVEWTGFLSGPSLEILKKYLDQAQAENYIPYAPTLGEYIDADEVTARYTNLQNWYGEKGHFWLGTGPYYVDGVFPVEGTLTLRRFEDYPDPADRWSQFGLPKVATVEVSGPGNVTIGEEAVFDVDVTFQGEPYAAEDIANVSWLVFDATGTLVATGEATAAGDGLYTVTLGADVTSALQAGSNRLQVAVSSNVVAIPSFASYEFVTAP